LYKELIRPALFRLNAEKAHHFTFDAVKRMFRLPGFARIASSLYAVEDKRLERKLFGLTFSNPVGLAAGFDKDARLVDELAAFGFGFIEIGTVTPKPQAGNEKPRLFRLPEDNAIINRMGFNNEGVLEAARRLKARKSKVIIGGNIGKNKVTPNEEAVADYLYCLDQLHDVVDYFVVNVSSPNTPGLRELQEKKPLTELLNAIQQRNKEKATPRPVLLKIAPDLTWSQLDDIIEIVSDTHIDGVIATNTTISRENLKTSAAFVNSIGMGGLSGKPLTSRSTEVVRYLCKESGGRFPVIGVGGIHSPQDALEKLDAGAALVQLYTGFIYEGPALIKSINTQLLKAK
jgi:dihydroorotate dehydrogenase